MWLSKIICVSLFFASHFSFFTSVSAQEPVAPLTQWLATVDEESQQIVLSWNSSDDPQTMGYHVCTGIPCLDYDTVFGRFDTTLFCADHAVTERHVYRLHVFDSAYNVSPLTPSFGNIVLTADVPLCSTEVYVSWTPYVGMPGGIVGYDLQVRLEPYDEDYIEIYTLYPTDSIGPYTYRFDIAEGVTRVKIRVEAVSTLYSIDTPLSSFSNIVTVERRTIDTAAYLDITSVEYDSVNVRNIITLSVDTSFHDYPYILWRSIDGSPWDSVAAFSNLVTPSFTYFDHNINPYDSLHCYQLSVNDACDLNPNYSVTRCVVVPDPLPPSAWFPNTLLFGDPINGTFLPCLRGLKGNLYELHIYNRMGLLVFHTTDPATGWTPDDNVSQGVYAYTLRCRFNDNTIKTYTGTILVLK